MGLTFYCPTKIIISEDARGDLARQVSEFPEGKIFVLTDAGVLNAGVAGPLIEKVRQCARDIIVFSDISGNPNVPDVTRALDVVQGEKPVAMVAIGGGSVIDTAKAVGILLNHEDVDWEDLQWGRTPVTNPSVPVIAIPTTAGTGSEVTHVAVIGDRTGFKKGLVHSALFPRAAIVDGSLMLSLPAKLTAATGMDALVHAVEAYLGQRANPITDSFALAAMRDLVHHLPIVTHDGSNIQARRAVAFAATLAGAAMDQSGLGLDHALCGPLAARYKLHHGLGITILFPATLEFNAPAIPPARWETMRAALDLPDSLQVSGLGEWARSFIRRLGLPVSIREAGIDLNDIDEMAHEATRMAMISNNIRAAGLEECKRVLETAL